jgi:hypothetical protein
MFFKKNARAGHRRNPNGGAMRFLLVKKIGFFISNKNEKKMKKNGKKKKKKWRKMEKKWKKNEKWRKKWKKKMKKIRNSKKKKVGIRTFHPSIPPKNHCHCHCHCQYHCQCHCHCQSMPLPLPLPPHTFLMADAFSMAGFLYITNQK